MGCPGVPQGHDQLLSGPKRVVYRLKQKVETTGRDNRLRKQEVDKIGRDNRLRQKDETTG